MQHISPPDLFYSDPTKLAVFFVGALAPTVTCYSGSKLKPELPEIRGSEDTFCLTKQFCISVLYPKTKLSVRIKHLRVPIKAHFYIRLKYTKEEGTPNNPSGVLNFSKGIQRLQRFDETTQNFQDKIFFTFCKTHMCRVFHDKRLLVQQAYSKLFVLDFEKCCQLNISKAN